VGVARTLAEPIGAGKARPVTLWIRMAKPSIRRLFRAHSNWEYVTEYWLSIFFFMKVNFHSFVPLMTFLFVTING
jgi:hypothetical protein